jgi:hypothetical protein
MPGILTIFDAYINKNYLFINLLRIYTLIFHGVFTDRKAERSPLGSTRAHVMVSECSVSVARHSKRQSVLRKCSLRPTACISAFLALPLDSYYGF